MTTSVAELKTSLLTMIAQTDDIEALEKIQSFAIKLLDDQDSIICYSSDGRPLNQAEYIKETNKARLQAEAGLTIPQEEIEKELWA